MSEEIIMAHKDDKEARSVITIPRRDRAFWESQGYVVVKPPTATAKPAKEEE